MTRKLTAVIVAATIVGFATPVLAGGGCGGSAHQKSAQTSKPTSTAEAPSTSRPSDEGGT